MSWMTCENKCNWVRLVGQEFTRRFQMIYCCSFHKLPLCRSLSYMATPLDCATQTISAQRTSKPRIHEGTTDYLITITSQKNNLQQQLGVSNLQLLFVVRRHLLVTGKMWSQWRHVSYVVTWRIRDYKEWLSFSCLLMTSVRFSS